MENVFLADYSFVFPQARPDSLIFKIGYTTIKSLTSANNILLSVQILSIGSLNKLNFLDRRFVVDTLSDSLC